MTYDGTPLPMRPHSILVHGDTPGAVALGTAPSGRQVEAAGGRVVPVSQLHELIGARDHHKAALSLQRQSVLALGRSASVNVANQHGGAHALLRLQDRSRHRRLVRHRRGRGRAVLPRGARGPRRRPQRRAAGRRSPSGPAASPTRIDVTRHGGARRASPARSSSTSSSTTRASTGPKAFLKAEDGDIDLLVDVNLRAVLHLCRLVVPGMVARDRGHVVNISSIAGAYNFGGNSTYHATKAAVSMLSRQLRIDAFGRARARHRDLPGPGRDRHLRPCPRRQPGDPRALHRRVRAAGGRRHRRRHRLRHRRARSPSTSATWRSPRPCRCRAASRRRGPSSAAETAQRLRPADAGVRPLRDPAEPRIRARCCWHGLRITFVVAIGSWCLAMSLGILLLVVRLTRRAASPNGLVAGYVSYHRNVPTLVQLMLWYFGISSLLPDRAADTG